MKQSSDKLPVGLIPAAGQGSRIAPLPCSKELYPIGFRTVESGEGVRPKTVSHYLLEKMRMAGIRNAYFILRDGKWDIPTYFGDGAMVDMNLGYLMTRLPFGTPYTLDQAYPFVRHSIVAFGFPDILFQGDDAFTKLLDRQAATEADVVLGLFPVDRPWTMDMVEVTSKGEISSIVIKPPDTHLEHGWIIAVWTPAFTEFLHEHLINLQKSFSHDYKSVESQPEVSVGHVFQAALRRGLRLQSVEFANQDYVDIGTPDGLQQAMFDSMLRTGMKKER
ncbi:MAG: sugar phosphate nucleotidyltransferase [Nitrospirota bacterium]